MAKQNWSDIGNIISDAVQEAIDTEDFSKLSQSIQGIVSTAISDAAESVARGVSSAADSVARGMNGAGASSKTGKDIKIEFHRPQAQNPWKGKEKPQKKAASRTEVRNIPDSELYAGNGGTTALGYTFAALGGCLTFVFGIGTFVCALLRLWFPVFVMLPFLAAGLFTLMKGTGILGKIKRFRSYVRALGTRKCISISELASSVGKSASATMDDVRRMISDGMFRQGHLDMNGKNLFVTDEGYEAYLEDHQRMERKKEAALAMEAQKQKERSAYKNNSALSDEVKTLIAEGRQYIDKIHAANEAIQDEEVSQKLDGLETVITKIFQHVEQKPEIASETKKLMKYYLPITIKLLESYQKFDEQPVQGPNILKSRKEIEDTLDTLNQAFARLFDNLYQDTSLDIASDISVLNTLLAQEGLTGEKI